MINLNKTKKYSKMAVRKIKNSIRTSIFLKTSFFIPTPMRAYYLVSNKCNFRCKMCSQWEAGTRENIEDYISEERMIKIIEEMKKNGIGELGISGGEPMLFKKKVFNLLKYANKKGIYTHFATNGSLLNKEILDDYNKIGGGHISLSLDAVGDVHDNLRGAKGAYDNVMRVLDLFKKYKWENIVLKINLVVANENLDKVLEVARLAVANNAIIFIQPYDAYTYGHKDVLAREKEYPLWVKSENYGKLREMIDGLRELKKKYPSFILNDEKHIEAMYSYFSDSSFYTVCYAGLDQIVIDPYGKMCFCKFREIADLNKVSLKEALKSKKRRDVIKASLKCKDGCLLGCMYRPSLKELIFNGTRQFIKLIK